MDNRNAECVFYSPPLFRKNPFYRIIGIALFMMRKTASNCAANSAGRQMQYPYTSAKNKKAHPNGCAFLFLVGEAGLDCIFTFGENYRVAAVETGGKQMSTGHLH